MRLIGAGLAVVGVCVAGSAMSLSIASSAHGVWFDLPSLNQFVRLTNQTLAFVNERSGGDPVPPLPELRHGVGLKLAEALGGIVRVGIQMAVTSVATRTQGAWTAGETSHPVDISLEASLVAFSVELSLVLIPDVLTAGVSVGGGVSRILYRSAFPRNLPTDWSLPFLPKNEDTAYTGSGPLGTIALGLSLPLGQGIAVGIEAGFRVAPPWVPTSGSAVLDLNADGMGDPVWFTGLWLGVMVRMEFNL